MSNADLLNASRALLDAMREVDDTDRMDVPRTSKTFTERKARAVKAVSVARRELAAVVVRLEGKTDAA